MGVLALASRSRSFTAELSGSELLGPAGARRELLPGGYLWLRWALSVVVVTILVAVLLLRLLGAHIVPA